MTVAQAGKQFSERVSSAYLWPRLPWVIIGFGILVRLLQYLYNASLNFDEAGVSLNVINRSLSQLREPLDYIQNAPLGFLALQRLSVTALGNSEFSLRLFPLLFGIASLPLFYALAKQYLKPEAIFIPLWIFALAQPLIHYSSQAKQYSQDVAIALFVVLLTTHIYAKGLTVRWLPLYAIVGGLAVWFSHPSIFVLAGMGTTLAVVCYSRNEWAKLIQLATVGATWLLSFSLTLSGSVGTVDYVFANQGVIERLSPLFLPFPPTSFGDFEWYIRTFLQTFKQPGGMFFPGIAAFTFLVGSACLYSENRVKFLLLASPLVFTLLASALGKYPLPGPDSLGTRFALFMVPFLLLFIGAGAQVFVEKVRPASSALTVTFLAFLCFSPVLSTAQILSSPRSSEEMKPIVSYIRNGWQPGDVILVFRDQPGFEYYANKFGFTDEDYVTGTVDDLTEHISSVREEIAGVNLWVVYGHATNSDDFDRAQKSLVQYLDTLGTKTGSVKEPGVALDIYKVGASNYHPQ